jgi:hypothetical protein
MEDLLMKGACKTADLVRLLIFTIALFRDVGVCSILYEIA